MVKKGYASGVWAIRRAQFEVINGFSNELWDWDMEDDDLNNRLKGKGYDMVCDLSRWLLLQSRPIASGRKPNKVIIN